MKRAARGALDGRLLLFGGPMVHPKHSIWLTAMATALFFGVGHLAAQPAATNGDPATAHREALDDPYLAVEHAARATSPARTWEHNGFLSVQVNVNSLGNNILGDAANEPSLAVDPTEPNRMVIGWRQFDTVASNFRQAGWGHTADGGQTWTFPGVIEPGIFRSDPVLDFDSAGNFYYDSLGIPGGDFCTDTFVSSDGGQTWGAGVFSYGGDKQWISVDRSGGIGNGHIYRTWNRIFTCSSSPGGDFNRSTDGGQSYEFPIATPSQPIWGVTAVGPGGEVYVVGNASNPAGYSLVRSTTMADANNPAEFDDTALVDLGGPQRFSAGPNPGGLLGQVWVAPDPTVSALVYVAASVDPNGSDPLDVHFVRSTDGGMTFSAPLRINDDPGTTSWQWFGTMAVAPDGRIDMIWNDSRDDPGGFDSRLYYSFSADGGFTWSPNGAVSPAFDPHLGWPNQDKIGDYYDMVSDLTGANVAYSATFNGEQDVYFLRIPNTSLFASGFEIGTTDRWNTTQP